MPILGIESSAHTLGIGIVQDGKVLSNERSMYPITNKGIIPSRVADFHANNVRKTLQNALRSAKLGLNDIDAIGYTKGPGLGACLQIGQMAAKSISQRLKIPIFPVNHAVAHIEITKNIFGMRDPLALYVSGGNSQILARVNDPYRHYHIYGETFDVGVGNMLDTFARAAKLNPAWGSTVAKAAHGGSYIRMPYTVKGMDFTFTGLLTNAIGLLNDNSLRDVSYSLQETAFAMLCEATERALFLTNRKELILCGGVAQSERLKGMLKLISNDHKTKFGVASNEFNADNGAMIALVAEKFFKTGLRVSESECDINQRYRIDKTVIV
jgi:N6-L-threonylcarbamoyladenine synthase